VSKREKRRKLPYWCMGCGTRGDHRSLVNPPAFWSSKEKTCSTLQQVLWERGTKDPLWGQIGSRRAELECRGRGGHTWHTHEDTLGVRGN